MSELTLRFGEARLHVEGDADLVARERASDLFLMAGAAPTIKRQGAFIPIAQQVLSAADVRQMAYSILREAQRKEFEATMECDLSLQTADGERFRVNVHMQRGQVGMVIRHVIARIPTLEELGLPPVLQRLAFLKGGLVLTVGSAGSGKTTTLAALLDHRNTHTGGHILTVEDPIEYLHSHKKSLVTQREVGLDTLSYDEALRRAMRDKGRDVERARADQRDMRLVGREHQRAALLVEEIRRGLDTDARKQRQRLVVQCGECVPVRQWRVVGAHGTRL